MCIGRFSRHQLLCACFSCVLLHRWTCSVAVEWSYSLEVPAGAQVQTVSWTKGRVLVTTVADSRGHVIEVNTKENKHRELMEVML